ncbi:MAG: tRNA (N(6)-L-threonylcarbamoyladenosine(37)-C(2))-methylthiotransferase MtaB [Planctomycetes bacterium]|nr:tRNA (N(6)-L-threonylcarbamoyladenosine(37)-C(2))-methylthiotransferase MtaB [Planctomycetota bacterium]
MLKFFLKTFGCKTNQYELQGIRESLFTSGFAEVQSAATADVAIVNTCAVTTRADASCRNAIRSINRENPNARIVVTGCCVDLEQDWIRQLECVWLAIPNGKKHGIGKTIARHFEEDSPSLSDIASDRFALHISKFENHTRAFIKIQDGCDNYCSYCTIPYARGIPESRPLSEIMEEGKRLVESGHRELVLTGINIGKYGHNDAKLCDVVSGLGNVEGLLRLRLGSVEPQNVTEELCLAVRDSATACLHIHIPLQNGDDTILKKMNRHYDTAFFRERVEMARSIIDTPSITTDIIVGFPGEGEKEFASTIKFCREITFARTHVFLFSARPGTPAYELKQTSTNREISARRDELIQLSDEMAANYAASFIGATESILIEEHCDNLAAGYSSRYLRTEIESDKDLKGECVDVLITGAEGAVLHGRAAK